jgi:GntR family transcriptional regulator
MIETRPIHEQLLTLCLRDLEDGRLQPGDSFPSERDLSLRHGVSRATANKVLAHLRGTGHLEHRRGIGCFVAERPSLFASLRQLESFTAFARSHGLHPETQVCEFERPATVSPKVRQALKLSAADTVIRVKRLRLLNGDPVILEERFLPAHRFPRLHPRELEGSFFQLCQEKYGLHPGGEEITCRAELPPPELDGSGPVLFIRGTGFDAEGAPLWVQRLQYRGDRFELIGSSHPSSPFPRIQLGYRAPAAIHPPSQKEHS